MTRFIHGFRVKQAQKAPEKKMEPPKEIQTWIDPERYTPMSDGYVLGVTETKAGKRSYAIVRYEGGEWKGTAAKVVAWMDLPLMPA